MSEVILRLPQVRERCGLSRSEIYRRIQSREFPLPVRLGLRAVGWKASAVESWIAERTPKGRDPRVTRGPDFQGPGGKSPPPVTKRVGVAR